MTSSAPPFNPWERTGIRFTLPWNVHDEKRGHFGRFEEFINENKGLDCTTKTAALKASPFVVSLTSYTGIQPLFMCSGIIVNSDATDGDFCSTILTSASLLRCPKRERAIADAIKVDVYLVDDSLYEGTVLGHDFHYNIAAISIKSSVCLQTAIIGNIDGSTEAKRNPDGSTSFTLVRHRDTTITLSPEMPLIALGRYHSPPYHIMAAPGALRLVDCDLDCEELLMADCEITKNGIGGPVISCNGCVIGMSFYEAGCVPFLPINIALKCLYYLQKHRKVPRPWIGAKLSDLETSGLGDLEMLNQTFPKVFEGVIVREADSDSPASHAGLCTGDVIYQLDETPLRNTLKFKSLLFDKANKSVEVIVKRAGSIAPLRLSLLPRRPRKVHRWPLPQESRVLVAG